MYLQCMSFLAWAVIALAYPICLTIRTIERGSMCDKRKVATYWTIFSFVYLFEHVFDKLLEWVPLWLCLRLIFICWLVMPQLNGASYLYQSLVHPYWQFKQPHAITQFCASCSELFEKLKKDSYFKLEENESGTQEKLIASKPECNEDGQILGEVRVMECTAKCDATESSQIENKTSSALQVISNAKLPDTSSSSSLPVFQTRWTCEICEVTVSSELTLQSHIRGKKHRAKAKLWCDFCNLRVSGEIDMIAHLKGKRHLAKLKKTFATSGAS